MFLGKVMKLSERQRIIISSSILKSVIDIELTTKFIDHILEKTVKYIF